MSKFVGDVGNAEGVGDVKSIKDANSINRDVGIGEEKVISIFIDDIAEANGVKDTVEDGGRGNCSDSLDIPEVRKKIEKFKSLDLISGNTVEDVGDYVSRHYGVVGQMRLKLAKFILKKLNYQLSPDVLLVLACPSSAKVVIATAGAGKTTSLQLDIVISKMLDAGTGRGELEPVSIDNTDVKLSRILYLNYNRHNKMPAKRKHIEMCYKVNSLIQEEISDDIESDTVHAFCYKWLKVFAKDEDGDVMDVEVISDVDKEKVWGSIITPRWKKFYGDNKDCVDIGVLDELYNYKMESMLDWEDFFETSKFVDAGLKKEFVKSCIKKYDGMKRKMNMYDFVDLLQVMIDVLETHPKYLNELQDRFRFIIADENQDFTALMNKLLLLLYNPERNKLVVVGDPDQVIYSFKGASPVAIVDLIHSLRDVEVLGLDTNYRCPTVIVEAAKRVLELNILRFDKPLICVKNGGRIIEHPMASMRRQSELVLKELNRIGPGHYRDTVLCYRNNKTAIILGEELYYAGVPFKVLDVHRPFNNQFFRHFYNALLALRECDREDLNHELFRFLPVSRQDWEMILNLNKKQRRSHLHDLLLPVNSPKGLTESFAVLVEISKHIEEKRCVDYFDVLVKLYRRYYFDFVIRGMELSDPMRELTELYMERLLIFFRRPYIFSYMVRELKERNVDRDEGVTMSTFHGLKGLEFDYILAADFNDSIFPDWGSIDMRYSKGTALEEKESENRLMYVLVTRTKRELHLFYSNTEPSVYVRILNPEGPEANGVGDAGDVEGAGGAKDVGGVEDVVDDKIIELGTISGSSMAVDNKLKFIKRLTSKRK